MVRAAGGGLASSGVFLQMALGGSYRFLHDSLNKLGGAIDRGTQES